MEVVTPSLTLLKTKAKTATAKDEYASLSGNNKKGNEHDGYRMAIIELLNVSFYYQKRA